MILAYIYLVNNQVMLLNLNNQAQDIFQDIYDCKIKDFNNRK